MEIKIQQKIAKIVAHLFIIRLILKKLMLLSDLTHGLVRNNL